MSVLCFLETICCERLVLWNSTPIAQIFGLCHLIPTGLIARLALIALTEAIGSARYRLVFVWAGGHLG